jgi:uncharacterized protein (TIGR02147 family)
MMQDRSIFEFESYKAFLKYFITSQPNQGHGTRSRMARKAGCQIAYMSRVLDDKTNLSLEQGIALAPEVGLNDEETNFFLLLIQLERAGSEKLRTHFRTAVLSVRKKRSNLKERFQVKSTLNREDQATYYSSWHYLAVHVALSIPKLQAEERIATTLGIQRSHVREILRFLIGVGLAQSDSKSGRLRIGNARLHLEKDSNWIARHHGNWRLQAIQSIERKSDEDLHYSAVVSLSETDATRLKELWIRTLEKFNEEVASSPEETLRCITIDFFGLGKGN